MVDLVGDAALLENECPVLELLASGVATPTIPIQLIKVVMGTPCHKEVVELNAYESLICWSQKHSLNINILLIIKDLMIWCDVIYFCGLSFQVINIQSFFTFFLF